MRTLRNMTAKELKSGRNFWIKCFQQICCSKTFGVLCWFVICSKTDKIIGLLFRMFYQYSSSNTLFRQLYKVMYISLARPHLSMPAMYGHPISHLAMHSKVPVKWQLTGGMVTSTTVHFTHLPIYNLYLKGGGSSWNFVICKINCDLPWQKGPLMILHQYWI